MTYLYAIAVAVTVLGAILVAEQRGRSEGSATMQATLTEALATMKRQSTLMDTIERQRDEAIRLAQSCKSW